MHSNEDLTRPKINKLIFKTLYINVGTNVEAFSTYMPVLEVLSILSFHQDLGNRGFFSLPS